MIKIALIEDNENDANHFLKLIERYNGESKNNLQVTWFPNPISFLDQFSGDFSIVFFDIKTPYIDGITAAKKLREISKSIIIIFLTNLAQFAIRGYEVDALDFLVKPANYYDFILKLERALERVKEDNPAQQIIVSGKNGKIVLPLNDIRYIESSNHQCIFHTEYDSYYEYVSLKSLEERLSTKGFARCNHCYLINMNYVTSIKGYTVFLGDTSLAISQPRKKAFSKQLTNFWGDR